MTTDNTTTDNTTTDCAAEGLVCRDARCEPPGPGCRANDDCPLPPGAPPFCDGDAVVEVIHTAYCGQDNTCQLDSEARTTDNTAEEEATRLLKRLIVRPPEGTDVSKYLGETDEYQAPGYPRVLVTHSGVFHADEIVGVAILLTLTDLWVVRTRDPEILKAALDAPEWAVLDVGGVYDPNRWAFDHHQRRGEVPPAHEGGCPQSSCGMAWAQWGRDALRAHAASRGVLLTPEQTEEAHARVGEVLRPIDASDCGWSSPQSAPDKTLRWGAVGISAIVGRLNPSPLFGGESRGGFGRAIGVAREFLQGVMSEAVAAVVLRDEVLSAVKAAEEAATPYILLPRGMPGPMWTPHAATASPGILYAIFPALGGGWMVQQVPRAPGAREGRKPLPEAWGGLEGADLQALLPPAVPPGAIFAHKGRFIGGHKTKEGAIAMALVAAAD